MVRNTTRAFSESPTIRPEGSARMCPVTRSALYSPGFCHLWRLLPQANEEAGPWRTRSLPRTRRLPRERLAALFVNPFRLHIPVRIRAETAVLAGEHLSGFLVAFERPQEPVRGDVGKLAAAGMKVRRAVSGVVPRAVESRHVVDRFERRRRRPIRKSTSPPLRSSTGPCISGARPPSAASTCHRAWLSPAPAPRAESARRN